LKLVDNFSYEELKSMTYEQYRNEIEARSRKLLEMKKVKQEV